MKYEYESKNKFSIYKLSVIHLEACNIDNVHSREETNCKYCMHIFMNDTSTDVAFDIVLVSVTEQKKWKQNDMLKSQL